MRRYFGGRAAIAVLLCVATISGALAATTGGRKQTISPPPSQSSKQKQPPIMHPEFSGAGQKAGIEIWRVENFKPVPYPKNDFGKFYTGDSYVIMNTKIDNNKKSWDIHFWLGSQTSQDESGAAAIFAVELDDQLNGSPVQHREVQEHESQLFLSYFKGGIRYLPGGVASGFTHVDHDAFEKKFYQVKGKRNVRVRQIEPSVSSMNKGDCFILDVKKNIYVYVGAQAKRVERLKAITAANQIRDQDHAGKSRVHIIDEYSNESEVQNFFDALGSGSRNAVPDEATGGDDEAFEKKKEGVILYKISDASGKTKYEQVDVKPLRQNLLDSNDCFILDTAGSGIYVWIGKKCTAQEKKDAMAKAQEFLTSKKYPAWTSVQRIVEHGEPAAFKQFFPGWRDKGELHSRIMRSVDNVDASDQKMVKTIDKSAGKAPSFMPDDGSGTVEIFRVENFELTPVEPRIYGMFFGGDSYVIKYMYNNEGNKYIIYIWQGKESTQDEKAASALHAVRLDNELHGRAMQIRVDQGNEPGHFLRIFKGKMIILMGGKASAFRNLHDYDSYDRDGTRLFRVRGTNDLDVHAAQMPEVAASLNSDDAFILETPGSTYVWEGHGASDFETAMAVSVANSVIKGNVVIVPEGEEPAAFWKALGGKGKYSETYDAEATELDDVQLFHCYIEHGKELTVESVIPFSQKDLDEDDTMILDSGDELYVWFGKDSSEDEKKSTMKMAESYIKDKPNRTNTVMFVVKQGEEPKSFTSLFPSWDANLWKDYDPISEMKHSMMEQNTLVSD